MSRAVVSSSRSTLSIILRSSGSMTPSSLSSLVMTSSSSSDPAGTVSGCSPPKSLVKRSAAPSERADSGRTSIATKRARLRSSSGGGARSGARQRARNSLAEEQEERAGDEDGDRDRSAATLAHDDVGDQAGGQGDGDRLHELQCGDERAAGIEQGLDAALAAGAGRGLAEPVAADQSRAGLDCRGAGHHQERNDRDRDQGPIIAAHGTHASRRSATSPPQVKRALILRSLWMRVTASARSGATETTSILSVGPFAGKGSVSVTRTLSMRRLVDRARKPSCAKMPCVAAA